ncbi:hypothetical protein C0R09_01330 [Brevibacillus laterosporus]|nr:hypothetical protein C0R09_01330 [Brevibacillus laterosporus]
MGKKTLGKEVVELAPKRCKVHMRRLGRDYVINVWNHVPDVLVFRQGNKPHLFQIKGASGPSRDEFKETNKGYESM